MREGTRVTGLYERDFHAWAVEQAALLRSGDLAAADVANIAEEIASLGRSEKRELVSRLTILLLHLLKWRHQPERRGASWEASILVQRDDVADHLRDNPSLRASLDQAMADAYRKAALLAAAETGLGRAAFPPDCPWSFERATDAAFWPE